MIDIRSLGTILGVWAHPDDEAYLSAGIMAMAVKLGSGVACITATRGELGSTDEERWPVATLGKVREAELMQSLNILGVTDHSWLDYRDGECNQVDRAEAIAKISAIIARVQPDSILTFGPDGMTGHDDHRAVSDWATVAFQAYAKPSAQLFYAVHTPEWYAQYGPKLEQFNVFFNIDKPPLVPKNQIDLAYELPKTILELKQQGMAAHKSQVEALVNAFGLDFFRHSFKGEYFVLADRKSLVPRQI